MAYEAKNFDYLLGLTGFSDRLLKNHFTLYQGYVINTNKLIELMMSMVKENKANTPEFAELKKDSKLYKKMVEIFGSGEECEKVFKATGSMRGIGWVVMYYDKEADKLFNTWINEHDVGHLAGLTQLLIMDVFEHAYMVDYDTKKADYIEAFIKSIDWDVVNKRFEDAL